MAGNVLIFSEQYIYIYIDPGMNMYTKLHSFDSESRVVAHVRKELQELACRNK